MQTLTREEISEFVKAFGRNKKKSNRSKEIRDYDLTNPTNNVTKGDLRAAERIMNSAAGAWSSVLSRAIRLPVMLQLNDPELSTAALYSQSMPVDSVLVTLRDGDGNDVLVNLPSELAIMIVNRLAGGRGEIHQRRSKLTHIEMAIVERFASIFCANLSDIAASFGSSGFSVAGVNGSLRVSDVALMAASGEWTMNGKKHSFSIALSSILVGKAAAVFEQGSVAESAVIANVDLEKLENTFGSVPIPVSVELGSVRVNMQDVKDMQIGDVIRLNQTVNDSVAVKIGKNTAFHSRAGVVGDNLAVRIGARVK